MTFWLDTNMLWDTKFLEKVAPSCVIHGHILSISPLVHAERLAQIARGGNSELSYRERLARFHVRVGFEDGAHAESASTVLHAAYPTTEAWGKAALIMYARRMGPSVRHEDLVGRCSGSLDPYIAAFAVGRGHRFVSHDGREDRLPHPFVLTTEQALSLAAGP